MEKNQIKGNWDIVKGKVKEKWGSLTDNDLTQVEGKKDQLIGKIEKKYGIAKEEAQKQVAEFEETLND